MFWKNITKINKKRSNMCSVIDDKVGDEACDAFCAKYTKLYDINPSVNMNEIHNKVNNLIKRECCKDVGHNSCEHLHLVTPQMVKSMMKKMKPKQYDEYCDILSDSLIHGTHRLFVLFASFVHNSILCICIKGLYHNSLRVVSL